MPVYQYSHPEYPIVIEVVQSMKDPHVYIDDEDVEWQRVWSAPNASIDTQVDPFDSKAFVDSTKNKKGTMGDLWDQAKEASEKRTDKLGHDPIKQKYFKNYSKGRKGMKHMNQKTEQDTL
jgi:hypothetical protein